MLLQIHLERFFNHTRHLYTSFCKFPFIPACTANPISYSPVNQRINNVTFVALNKSAKTFDGLDQQNSPEKHSHHIIADIIFTMGKQPLDPVA